MKAFLIGCTAIAVLCLGIRQGFTDHPGGGAGSSGALQAISEEIFPPRSNVGYTFEYNHLDNGVGLTILNQFLGEWGVKDVFAVGGRIPVWTVYQDFVPDNTRLGDVAIMLKGRIWGSPEQEMGLMAGLDTSFPTGNDEISLGAGVVTFTPFLVFKKMSKWVDVFAAVLGSFEVDAVVNPSMSYEVGVIIRLVKGALPFNLHLAFQGSTFIASDTWNNGNSKGYLMPGILLELTEHWDVGILGKISVLDTLSFRSDVTPKDFRTGLFTDILGGIQLHLGYTF